MKVSGTKRVKFKRSKCEIMTLWTLEIFVKLLGKETKNLYQASSVLLLTTPYIMQIEDTGDISGKSCLSCI